MARYDAGEFCIADAPTPYIYHICLVASIQEGGVSLPAEGAKSGGKGKAQRGE